MDPTAQMWTTAIIAFVFGAGGLELIRIVSAAITGSLTRRRNEVNRIAAEKTALERERDEAHDQRDETERRLRVITEHAHAVRVLAIKAGISLPEFPAFREDPS